MSEKPRVRNIADLARIAGVSPGTVSRALTGAGLISQSTRDRIRELAREHDFRPNVMARNLRIRRTGAIGVAAALDGADGVDQAGLLGRIADALEDRGYVLVLTRLRPDDPARLETFVESGRIDALIVLTPTRTWPAGGTTPVVNWDGTDDAGALVDNVLRRVSGEAA